MFARESEKSSPKSHSLLAARIRGMPIYEYQCGECDSRFEALVMGSAPEPDSCECGSQSIERVYSTFSASSGNSPAEACPTPAEQRCGGPACMHGMCGMN